MKKHLKYKNKPLCNVKRQKRKLQYVEDKSEVTCQRCLNAVER
jgi:hypothetical protein